MLLRFRNYFVSYYLLEIKQFVSEYFNIFVQKEYVMILTFVIGVQALFILLSFVNKECYSRRTGAR